MPTYTIQIQAQSEEDPRIWHGLHPAKTYESDGSAFEAAKEVASNQTVATSENWRVRAWVGADADTGTEPAGEYYEYDQPDTYVRADQLKVGDRVWTEDGTLTVTAAHETVGRQGGLFIHVALSDGSSNKHFFDTRFTIPWERPT